MEYGVLENKKVFVEPCRERWIDRYIATDRIVKTTMIGKIRVSTVFLGINHGFIGFRPLWFETMIFFNNTYRPDLDGYQDRCETWEQAEAMHERACELVKCHVPFGNKSLWHRITKPLLFILNGNWIK